MPNPIPVPMIKAASPLRLVLLRRYGRPLVGALSVAVFLLLWQIVGSNNIVRADLISYPGEIVEAARELFASGELGSNILVSLHEFTAGLLMAVFGGILMGIGFALSRPLRYLFEPFFVALYSAPLIAFVPILVLWLGIGTQSKIGIVFLAAIVPITINTMTGVSEVSESWIRALRAFGATPGQVVLKAVLPGALPVIMAGIRLAIGRGIIGLIAAEMYGAIAGVGRLIQTYSTSDRPAFLFVLVAIVSAFGLACVSVIRVVENRLVAWKADSR